MRRDDHRQAAMFSDRSPEERVPPLLQQALDASKAAMRASSAQLQVCASAGVIPRLLVTTADWRPWGQNVTGFPHS